MFLTWLNVSLWWERVVEEDPTGGVTSTVGSLARNFKGKLPVLVVDPDPLQCVRRIPKCVSRNFGGFLLLM